MATMTFNRKDFCSLVGKEFSVKEMSEMLPMLGMSWERVEGDEIEVEIFPNRPDMLSVEGLARAFAAFAGVDVGLPEYSVSEPDYNVSVDVSTESIRPYITCAVVKGVKLDDVAIKSLMQLQEKLHATHCRRRAKASIGVYDLSKIKFPLKYTTVDRNFKFTPLDWNTPHTIKAILEKHQCGMDYSWILEKFERVPILMDSKEMVLSMPPIINSHDTAVTHKTKDLFIDVTGTDHKTINEVLNIVVSALADRDGKIVAVEIEGKKKGITPDLTPRKMKFELGYANKLLGIKLGVEGAITLLKKMNFDAEAKDGKIDVSIPSYRTDIMHPIDLVEDVAVAYGYQNFEPELPPLFTVGGESETEVFSRKVISLMLGMGFQEGLTYMLSNKTRLFDNMNMDEEATVQTVNPRTAEFTSVRNWLLPSLIEALTMNQHNLFPQKIVEAGDCVMLDGSTDTGTKTIRKLAGVVTHDTANLTECRSIINSLLENLGLKYEIRPVEHPSFIPSRVGEIIVNGKFAGIFGEIHPLVLSKWKLEKPVIAFELDLDMLS